MFKLSEEIPFITYKMDDNCSKKNSFPFLQFYFKKTCKFSPKSFLF